MDLQNRFSAPGKNKVHWRIKSILRKWIIYAFKNKMENDEKGCRSLAVQLNPADLSPVVSSITFVFPSCLCDVEGEHEI